LLHLLAVFHRDLPGECDDSRNGQHLNSVSYHWGEWDGPDVS
jgi:hypothetical protein